MNMHVVITGASRGIGYNLCKQYLQAGYRVTAAVRNASDELKVLNVDIVDGVDVSSSEGVARLQQALGETPVDILINNAGVFLNEDWQEMDFDSLEKQFAVNAMGPVRVTHALRNNLTRGAKVAMITSRMGSIADNGSGSYLGYRMSKAALNAAGVNLAHELRSEQVAVGLFHPGFVQTQMVGFAGDISPQVAAERLVQRIDELNMENSGGFWHSNGEALPW